MIILEKKGINDILLGLVSSFNETEILRVYTTTYIGITKYIYYFFLNLKFWIGIYILRYASETPQKMLKRLTKK